jgi:ribosomal protein S18 acetylase RimI-like enzyme
VKIRLTLAKTADAPAIARLRTEVAKRLAEDFGLPPRKSAVSEKSVLYEMRYSLVCIARKGSIIMGVLQLLTKKPWAIDKSYFTKCARPIYLVGMAVDPKFQRRGVGRAMLADAARLARSCPGDAIRLDAYDAPHGAGEFYAKCGYKEVKRAAYKGTPLIYYELKL